MPTICDLLFTTYAFFLASLDGATGVSLGRSRGYGHVEKFTIDLDLPPAERWKEVALAFKDIMPSVCLRVRQLVPEAGLDQWMANSNIRADYLSELVGFAKWVDHPRVDLETLILWQLNYEIGLGQASSGILAADPNGTVVHGRNINWDVRFIARGKRMSLEELLIETSFVRHGAVLFTSTGFAGQIGVTSGMTEKNDRNGYQSWTFQQNWRCCASPNSNLVAATYGGLAYPFVARSLMESGLDFKHAVRQAVHMKLMAPSTFVMAGSNPWEGAVLAMDRLPTKPGVAELLHLQVLSKSIGKWFILQSDNDFWIEGSHLEVIKRMNVLGQANVNADTVLAMIRTHPLFNDGTVMSWLGTPNTGYYVTYKSRESLRIMANSAKGPVGELERLSNLSRHAMDSRW